MKKKEKSKGRVVDYDHILQIVKRYADENKSAREVYLSLIFVFGE